jgi:hypothetical protein
MERTLVGKKDADTMSESVGVSEERFDELWDICAMKFRERESRKKSDIIDIVIEECDNVEEVACIAIAIGGVIN